MNEITLTQPLKFGRCKGDVPLDLIKTNKGLNYLAWVFNNTDIPMDCHLVNTLESYNLVSLNKVRKNSREVYPQVTIIEGGNLSKVVTEESFQKGIERARKVIEDYKNNQEVTLNLSKTFDSSYLKLFIERGNQLIAEQIRQRMGEPFKPQGAYGLNGRTLVVNIRNND